MRICYILYQLQPCEKDTSRRYTNYTPSGGLHLIVKNNSFYEFGYRMNQHQVKKVKINSEFSNFIHKHNCDSEGSTSVMMLHAKFGPHTSS